MKSNSCSPHVSSSFTLCLSVKPFDCRTLSEMLVRPRMSWRTYWPKALGLAWFLKEERCKQKERPQRAECLSDWIKLSLEEQSKQRGGPAASSNAFHLEHNGNTVPRGFTSPYTGRRHLTPAVPPCDKHRGIFTVFFIFSKICDKAPWPHLEIQFCSFSFWRNAFFSIWKYQNVQVVFVLLQH